MRPTIHRFRAALATTIAVVLVSACGLLTTFETVHAATKSKSDQAFDVEARIKQLHKSLHITPEQESLFNNVAEAMRENTKAMNDKRSQTTQDMQSKNAVDQLNAYASVIDSHAEQVHKFIPVFQTLYDSMSETQKKTADSVFRSRIAEARKKHHE